MGDSDFRKLSLLLIITWIPFPLWFSLSIEGFGVITDYLVIEMGWVALNIAPRLAETARNGLKKALLRADLEVHLHHLDAAHEAPRLMLGQT